jgi:hypothetical protein
MKKHTCTKPPQIEWLEYYEGPSWVEEILYGVHEGCRHDSAVRLVGRWYGRGFSAEEVRRGLYTWNQYNHPPLDSSEIESILKSTTKWEIK